MNYIPMHPVEESVFDLYEQGDIIQIHYDVKRNLFLDSGGYVIYDIHRLVSPTAIAIFKSKADYYIVPDVTRSFLVEMIYPDECSIDNQDYDYS